MQLTIRFNDQDRTLYADLSYGEDPEPITLNSLTGKLEEAGYSNLKLDPKVTSEFLASAQREKDCTIPLKTLVDATVSVSIASDKHQATLTLTAPDGGQPLTLDMITQAIAKAGLCDELVDHDAVTGCLQRHTVKDLCIAKARLPVEGKDAEFFSLVECEKRRRPKVDEHGVADLLNTHQFLVVDVGTPLMRRVSATPGEPGLDVTGKDMKPIPGNDPGFAGGLTGVIISAEHPNLLVAAIKGHPVLVSNGVNVDPTLHMDRVDVTSGNIRFDGSLEVKGEVAAGMTIEVTGDVWIQGGVDRAAIQAGHSITVGGGIFGEEEDDPMEREIIAYQINAGADIEAKFVHLSTMSAGQNIVVKEYISHSSVKAGHQVLLGQETGKGLLYGGHCEALHRMTLNQLGNAAYIPTSVTAGKLNELSRVYYNLDHELTTRSQEAEQLETILQKTRQRDPVLLGKTPLDKSQKIRNTLDAIHDKMAKTRELLQSMETELALQKEAAIEVTRRVYPNAVMTINGTVKRFSEEAGGETWVQWEDEVLEEGKVPKEKPVEPKKKE